MGTDTTYDFTYYHTGATPYSITSTTQTLIAMRGFGMPPIEIPGTRAPYANGIIPAGNPMPYSADDVYQHPHAMPYLGPREMELAIRINAATIIALDTAYVAMVAGLTPYYPITDSDSSSYRLRVLRPYTGSPPEYRLINCWCTGVSDLEMKGRTNAIVNISFFAPDPFFYPSFGDAAYETGWATGTNPKTVTNAGHADVWPVIKVMGAAGETIVGLHITNNTTGKIWSTSQTIAVGITKYVRVLMDRAQMYYYDGSTSTDIISKMDSDAEFWPLQVGANALQWSSTSGTPSSIEVIHPSPYLAV
jgi:hypothetical protein